ncbi:TPA: antiviral reverse transcriptase Drt3a [Yersinia enterocolitica]
MLNQTFSSSNLIRLLNKDDPRKFRIGRNSDEYIINLKQCADRINEDAYLFSGCHQSKINGKNIFILKEFVDLISIRKANDNIKRIFSIKQADRNDIVTRVKIMLSEPIPFYIYKLDIKSFYESIDRGFVLKKIYSNSLVSYRTKRVISKFFETDEIKNINGLPRGVGLSATLSELFLEGFDKIIKINSNIYYYSRYVDDVIIFSHKKIDDFIAFFEKLLPGSLSLNKDKCREITIHNEKSKNSSQSFSYLGYNFTVKNGFTDKNNRDLSLKIAESKIKKLKKRIILTLKSYAKNKDVELARKRFRYLTANIAIEKKQNKNDEERGALYSGIYYNYIHLTEYTQLLELDGFKSKCLFSKRGSLGKGLISCNQTDLKSLRKYSFLSGYNNRRKTKFTYAELKLISACW